MPHNGNCSAPGRAPDNRPGATRLSHSSVRLTVDGPRTIGAGSLGGSKTLSGAPIKKVFKLFKNPTDLIFDERSDTLSVTRCAAELVLLILYPSSDRFP